MSSTMEIPQQTLTSFMQANHPHIPMRLGARPPNRKERRAAAAAARASAYGLPTPAGAPVASQPRFPTKPLAPTAKPFVPSATAKAFTPTAKSFIPHTPSFIPAPAPRPQFTEPISYFPAPNPTPTYPAFNPRVRSSMHSTPSYTPGYTPAVFTPMPAASSTSTTPPTSTSTPAAKPAARMCQVIAQYHSCGCRTKLTNFCNVRGCNHERPTQVNVGKLMFPCTAKWTGNSTPGAGAGPRGPACNAPDPGMQGYTRDMGMGQSFNNLLVLKGKDLVQLDDVVEALPEGVSFEDWVEALRKTCEERKEEAGVVEEDESEESMVQVSTQTDAETTPPSAAKDASPEINETSVMLHASDMVKGLLEDFREEMAASQGTQLKPCEVVEKLLEYVKKQNLPLTPPLAIQSYAEYLVELMGKIA